MPRESLQHRVVKLDNGRYRGTYRKLSDVNVLVMHHTGGGTVQESMDWMNRKDSENPTSYHYLIERDGTIYRMTPQIQTAYHAGDSWWPDPVQYPPGNKKSLNKRSIGISWANRGDGELLTAEQVTSGLWLCSVFVPHTVPLANVVGHYEVSPGRKPDPKPAMDMDDWRAKLADYLQS